MTTESRGFEPLHICCQSCPIVWTLNFIPWGFPVSEVRCMYTSTTLQVQSLNFNMACYLNLTSLHPFYILCT